ISEQVGSAPFSYIWDGQGNIDSINEILPGTYNLTVTDANGCQEERTFTIAIESPVELEILTEHPFCSGESSGSISLLPTGTNSQLWLNGLFSGELDAITNLPAGDYELMILDTLGCEQTFAIELTNPVGFSILLPPDTILRIGDSLRIQPQMTGISPSGARYQWYPTDFISCDTCAFTYTRPFRFMEYVLTVFDPDGCSQTDSIKIYIDDRERVYIPNAFSPNNDGINDQFTVFAGPEVERIELLQIHERWGGMVYSAENFPPNQPTYGWDGTYTGRRLNPGVYVYHIRMRLFSGEVVSLAGEVVLLR
ncbi:MAG: gliding motility-associated C-terminal domain-containing protein, partial [Bacteroidota bacterium]